MLTDNEVTAFRMLVWDLAQDVSFEAYERHAQKFGWAVTPRAEWEGIDVKQRREMLYNGIYDALVKLALAKKDGG